MWVDQFQFNLGSECACVERAGVCNMTCCPNWSEPLDGFTRVSNFWASTQTIDIVNL